MVGLLDGTWGAKTVVSPRMLHKGHRADLRRGSIAAE